MNTEELNRFDRTLAIMLLLQSGRLVRAQQMAARFGVSVRTIYRDIRSLAAAGVPIIGEAGSGYSLMEGYRLPPVMFSREEASSFVAAEKLMHKFTDAGLGAHFTSAMNKIRSVLKGQELDWIAALDAQVWVQNSRALFNENIPNALEILFNSIAIQQQVYLEYRSFAADHTEARHIEPVGVFHEYDQWYLFAFCHLRNEYRQFRTDRIHAIRRMDRPFTRKHGRVSDHKKQAAHCSMQRVVIAVAREVMPYIERGRQFYGYVAQEEKGAEIEMVFETDASMDGLARWYLMFGDCARVVEPAAFKTKVQELAEKTSANLQR